MHVFYFKFFIFFRIISRLKKGCNMANSTLGKDGHTYMSEDGLRHIRRAYASCISYVDDIIGNITDQLKQHDLLANTIIVVTSDHGFHMGENAHFGKGTVHELSTRVPLILHIPGRTERGVVSRSPVEAVDLFQTLVSAAGLPPVSTCQTTPAGRKQELCTGDTYSHTH